MKIEQMKMIVLKLFCTGLQSNSRLEVTLASWLSFTYRWEMVEPFTGFTFVLMKISNVENIGIKRWTRNWFVIKVIAIKLHFFISIFDVISPSLASLVSFAISLKLSFLFLLQGNLRNLEKVELRRKKIWDSKWKFLFLSIPWIIQQWIHRLLWIQVNFVFVRQWNAEYWHLCINLIIMVWSYCLDKMR